MANKKDPVTEWLDDAFSIATQMYDGSEEMSKLQDCLMHARKLHVTEAQMKAKAHQARAPYREALKGIVRAQDTFGGTIDEQKMVSAAIAEHRKLLDTDSERID